MLFTSRKETAFTDGSTYHAPTVVQLTWDIWYQGCNSVEEYLDASEIATWICTQEQDVSHEYATKLARRPIDGLPLLRAINHCEDATECDQ